MVWTCGFRFQMVLIRPFLRNVHLHGLEKSPLTNCPNYLKERLIHDQWTIDFANVLLSYAPPNNYACLNFLVKMMVCTCGFVWFKIVLTGDFLRNVHLHRLQSGSLTNCFNYKKWCLIPWSIDYLFGNMILINWRSLNKMYTCMDLKVVH